MSSYKNRSILLGLTILVSTSIAGPLLHAQTKSSANGGLTLRDAIEAAWLRHPAARAAVKRRGEFTAKRDAAKSIFAQPPSISVSQRSDKLNQDKGETEYEAELSVPLWMPGARSSTRSVADAELTNFDAKIILAKLRLAGEVREAYWQVRLATNERDITQRRANEAGALARDVARRVKSGDLARANLNQALALEQQARASVHSADAVANRALRVFSTLSGLPRIPDTAEVAGSATDYMKTHPILKAHQHAADAARARLKQSTTIRRDPPELIVGATRSRDDTLDPYNDTVKFGIKIPLGTGARNRPRIAAASADLEEAEAEFALERDRVAAEVDASRIGLEQTKYAHTHGANRLRLAIDTHKLHSKAFRLGEIDLQTRLRTENERYDAELALSRSQLDVGRATSRLNQAYGLLP